MEEKKKMGRPTDNPKTNRIHLRVDNETLKLLDECVEIKKTSKSEIIREGIELVRNNLNNK